MSLVCSGQTTIKRREFLASGLPASFFRGRGRSGRYAKPTRPRPRHALAMVAITALIGSRDLGQEIYKVLGVDTGRGSGRVSASPSSASSPTACSAPGRQNASASSALLTFRFSPLNNHPPGPDLTRPRYGPDCIRNLIAQTQGAPARLIQWISRNSQRSEVLRGRILPCGLRPISECELRDGEWIDVRMRRSPS